MKPESIEGSKATENFEEGMKALFIVPKDKVVKVRRSNRRRLVIFTSDCKYNSVPKWETLASLI